MAAVFYLAMKDLRLLWRNKAGLFFVIVFPLLMALFFGSIFSSGGGGKAAAMKVAVVDLDASELSVSFVEALGQSQSLEITPMPLDSARELVRRGKMSAYLLIKPGYGSQGPFGSGSEGLELGIDPARKTEAGYLQGMIMQAAFKPMMEMFSNPAKSLEWVRSDLASLDSTAHIPSPMGAALKDLLGGLESMLELQESDTASSEGIGSPMSGPKIEVVDIAIKREGPRSAWEITFPQSLIWALIACASSFAVSIVIERTRGTFLRLRLAPITRAHILAGKGLACFVACVSVMTILLTIGITVFGVRIGNIAHLILAIAASGFCFVGVMMVVSVIGKTEEAVGGGGWAIMLVFAMTGGGMVPLMMMPKFMLAISHISPVKWSILAVEGAIWRGFSTWEMMTPLAVLTGIGLLGFAIGTTILTRSD